MKRIFTIVFVFTSFQFLFSQTVIRPTYYTGGYFPIKSGSFVFGQPFTGGLNSPQFQNIDLDNDGAGDLLIYDRNDGSLLTYLRRNGNEFLFAPKYEPHIPACRFFCKTADLNADGKMDIFTLDEVRNLVIYKNITQPGDSFPKFLNLGQQVYRNQYDSTFWILFNAFTLSNTDMPEIGDVDSDGDLDIVAYDPFYNLYTMYKDVRVEKGWNTDTFEFQKWDVCFGYFNDFNYSINLGSCPYQQKLKLRHTGGSSCLMFDNDEDGDKEMILSSIGQKAMYMVTNGKADYSHEYDTMTSWDSIFPAKTTRATDYDFPAGYLFDVNGDSIMDLITAPNGISDVKETQQTWYYRNFGKNNKPDFQFVKNNFIGDKSPDFGAASSPAFCDEDGDGDMDLFVASNGDFYNTQGVKDRVSLFRNNGTNSAPVFEKGSDDYFALASKGWSDIIIRFGDVDGDGDQDMLIGDRQGYVHWFRNSAGVGKPLDLSLVTNDLVGGNFTTGETNAAPLVYDYNHDTLPDILVGYYHGAVILYQNTGSIASPQYQRVDGNAYGMHANEWLVNVSNPGFASYGYAVPELADIDKDGQTEIVLGTAYGRILVYHYAGHNITDSLIADTTWLWKRSVSDSIIPDFGYKIVPTMADITGDSIPELFLGCSRGGLQMASAKGTVLSVKQFRNPAALANFDIYPNPASANVQITRENIRQNWKVEIRDLNGKLFYSGNMLPGEYIKKIPVNDLAQGVYIVSMTDGNACGYSKLVIQHNDLIR